MGSKETAFPAEERQSEMPDQGKSNAAGWKMPVPKFQQTSGYLPKGYAASALRKFSAAQGQNNQNSAEPEVAAETDAAVGPQPDIVEQIEAMTGPAVANTPDDASAHRKNGIRWTYVILGLALMLVGLAVFILVVFFLFIAPRTGEGPF